MSDSHKYSRPYDQGAGLADERDLIIKVLREERAELQYALNTVARLIDNLDPAAINRDEADLGVLSAALEAILLVIDPYVP